MQWMWSWGGQKWNAPDLEPVAGPEWPIRPDSSGGLIGGHPVSLVVRPQKRNMNAGPPIEIDDAFFPSHEQLFTALVSTVSWDGRMAARRTASFGRPYNYSQIQYPETPIPSILLPLMDALEARLRIRFNNCLLNYYETGDNTMGFHSDDTTGLRPGTGVAIVSLGSVRDITYRSKDDPQTQTSFALQPGSMLYMDAAVQEKWVHAIKKQKDAGPRISLTWRAFL